jgi:hypothetical protein
VQKESGVRFAISVFVGVGLYYAAEVLLSSLGFHA